MTHDDELIERVARVLATSNIASIYKRGATPSEADHYWPSFRDDAQAAIATVRAYDAERRASVLDVDALKSFDPKSPGTLVWLPDGMPSIPAHDPDDYRDLPVAMTGPVRFRGGLTEKKRD